MRRPQKPPDWKSWLLEDKEQVYQAMMLLNRPDLEDFVRTVNDKYLHWDKLRFRKLPEGVSAQLVWAAVKMARRNQRQPLPLSFTSNEKISYTIVPRHFEWLHDIDKQAGGAIGIGGSEGLIDDDDRYLYNSLMEEAIASSQLEGAVTTRPVAKKMLRENRKPRNEAEQMILNNYRAILEVRDLKKEKLTPEMLCHLQRVLTENTLRYPDAAGRFRKPEEPVVVEDTTTGEELHVPPSADQLEWRIREICNFANELSQPFIHPVTKAAVLHFMLGFVHPFVDGNGRTARAIFYWYMLKRNYWLFEYIPISRILIKSPAKYGRAYLYTETDQGDVTYFIRFHIQAIRQAIDQFHQYAQNELRETKEAAQLLESLPGLNHRQRSLIHDMLKRPSLKWTTRTHEGKYHVTYPTAHSDLLGLVDAGLIYPVKTGKTSYYYPANDLRRRLRLPGGGQKPPEEKIPKGIAVTRLKTEGEGKGKKGDVEQKSFFD